MMDEQTNSLLESLDQYEMQLTQINQAIDSVPSISDKQDLYALKKDIEELIFLTKETLNRVSQPTVEDSTSSLDTQKDLISDEYALFKAEIAELEGNAALQNSDTKDLKDPGGKILKDLQEDLDALKGSKCQAPHKQKWENESYHNALVMDIEAEDGVEDITDIKVRVMFVNPTEKDMLPCPYYLNGECRFADEKCHYSHGEVVALSSIKEYREPDFSSLKVGSQVLAKQKGNLWHRAKVKDILENNKCLVQFESQGCDTTELDLQDILPLERESKDGEESSLSSSDSSTSSSDSESELISKDKDVFVQLALMRNPPSTVLGAWEKHTKGIGSRLMASMGYEFGTGLGKHGEGRLEPVEALAYPPGKSLDACMALREAAGGDQDMFKAERKQKKKQNQILRLQQLQNLRQTQKKDMFSFMNSKLSGTVPVAALPSVSPQTTLASSSRTGLNVERFRLGEHIKKVEKDIVKLKQSLHRHEKGSVPHNAINNKLEEAQLEMAKLEKSDNLIAKEQDQRDGCKKISVF